MIVSTVIATTVAAAQPQAAPSQPASPDQGHGAMQHGEKMACCEQMAAGEGCCCCKGEGGKAAKADSPACQGQNGHADHDH